MLNKSIQNLKTKSMQIIDGTYSCDSDFANLCTLMATLDFFVADEEYEECAKIVTYIKTDQCMKQVKDNFTDYFDIWLHTNKIF